MLTIAITGGMGSGKSTLCKQIEDAGIPVFYCDVEARQLIASDATLRSQIEAVAGSAERTLLRQYIGQGPEYADKINQLVWPRVAKAWLDRCQAEEQRETAALIMECALLYESGFHTLVQEVIAITAPCAERIKRVVTRDSISPQRAESIMALQLSEQAKAARATHVINNCTSPARLFSHFKELYPQLWKHE